MSIRSGGHLYRLLHGESGDRPELSADQIRELAQDDTRYLWGYEDGRGEPIQRTIVQFLEEFIFSVDYTQATSVGWMRSL